MTLLFGAGAAITLAPVSMPPGETFYRAAKALKPVDDSMRVGLDMGPATDEMKKAVLSGSLKLTDIGDVRVAICKTPTDCVPMAYRGPYFSRDKYGFGFDASGAQLKGAIFVGVKINVDRPLSNVTITWSNYSQ